MTKETEMVKPQKTDTSAPSTGEIASSEAPAVSRATQLDALRARADTLEWDPVQLRMFLVDLVETLK
jgi:hypothetical protein